MFPTPSKRRPVRLERAPAYLLLYEARRASNHGWVSILIVLPGALRARSSGHHVQLVHLEAARVGGERREQAAGGLRRSLRVGDLATALAHQVRVRARPGLEKRRPFR